MAVLFIYITTKNAAEAHSIGNAIVEERLAACVNIIDNMRSIYHWDGKICEDSEVVLIAKTRQPLVAALIKRVKELHSYSCPCIVALPVTAGNAEYLTWVQHETGESE